MLNQLKPYVMTPSVLVNALLVILVVLFASSAWAVDGNTTGDMQYWDGSTGAWEVLPAPPVSGKTLNFCNGLPTWTAGGCLYAIGDIGPAGGIVFYITDGGLHGLEAAPEDQSNAEWGCEDTAISGADKVRIGTGAQNTADIVAGCSETGIAAKIADDYSLNGYTDWFLPSKRELHRLYKRKDKVGVFNSDFYWSSSEIDGHDAWAHSFTDEFEPDAFKSSELGVRAVRAF